MLNEAKDVPMLDMFGGEDWTPSQGPPRHLQAGRDQPLGDLRVGSRRPKAPDGLEGNFVENAKISFDEVLCGSIFGAPAADVLTGRSHARTRA